MFGLLIEGGFTLVLKRALKVVWNLPCLKTTLNGNQKWCSKGFFPSEASEAPIKVFKIIVIHVFPNILLCVKIFTQKKDVYFICIMLKKNNNYV